MGTTVMETKREASNAKVTVKAISLNNCPATPFTKTMGKNTETVVRVEAITAEPTSLVPLRAAS